MGWIAFALTLLSLWLYGDKQNFIAGIFGFVGSACWISYEIMSTNTSPEILAINFVLCIFNIINAIKAT